MSRFLRSWLETALTLDPRGLAFFRIFLGGLICLRLLLLLPHLPLTLGPEGVAPQAAVIAQYGEPPLPLSLYFQPDSMAGVYGVVALHLVVAAAFMVGWRTRVMTVLLWLLLLSLNVRNPWIINSGDRLAGFLLLWGMFLPLGQVFSLDARRGRGTPRTEAGRSLAFFGAACLVFQLVIVYRLTGYAKSDPVWLNYHVALQNALSHEAYPFPPGRWLLEWPGVMKGLTIATIYLEIYAILLLLSPWRSAVCRTAVSLLYIGFHIGIGLTLNVGLFSWISVAAWFAMLPPAFYDRVFGFLSRGTAFPRFPLPLQEQTVPKMVLLAILIQATTVVSTRSGWSYRGVAKRTFHFVGLRQNWKMFAPRPYSSTSWYAVVATNRDGWECRIYPDRETAFHPPGDDKPTPEIVTFYFRKLFEKLDTRKNKARLAAISEGFARQWLPAELQDETAALKLVVWQKEFYPTVAPDFEPGRVFFELARTPVGGEERVVGKR
ncbi:MAG TPA: HTTM domain-containing protein [Chthoniobacteraceae bacterium]|nr:HTTM domain-containing protein [Chthoniobacteraceae bacterium]